MIYDKFDVTPYGDEKYKNSKTSIQWNLPCGHVGRKSLEAMNKMFRTRGKILCRACAQKEDYADGSRKSRKRNPSYVDTECSECGTKKRITHGSYLRQLKKNNGKIICSSCSKKGIKSKGLKQAKKEISDLSGTFLSNDWNTTKDAYLFLGKCGHEFESRYDNTLAISKRRGFIQCPKCSIKEMSSNKSKGEEEVATFIESLGVKVIRNYRETKTSFEFDIYVPDYNLAIEYHGTYWHSESILKTKTGIKVPSNYHRDKWLDARKRNVQLLQIFDSEWKYKKHIIQDIIKNKCMKTTVKFNARSCSIEKVSQMDSVKFLDENHIFGKAHGVYGFGLYFCEVLVALISVRMEGEELNIVRYASLKDTIVRGGFSKLLKYVSKLYEHIVMFTYADNRFSKGALYDKVGFKEVSKSSPSYWYFKKNNPSIFLNRRNFQKKALSKKLENYDSTKTEYENMLNNGYDRVWDAGHIKFTLMI